MENLFGGSFLGFFGLTLVLFAGASWMMGQALALTWRGAWQLVPYAALLAATDRFLAFALFSGDLSSLPGFLLAWASLCAVAAAAFRATRAGQMAAQYPWLFERTGPFSWRARG
ncbi:MAG: hypothetical protein FJX21_09230 [Alphaproteobacteria bacterium]|nr:hypothetical protein [Alphaproteobacteria bacterium]